MPGPIHAFLAADHARLDELLQRAIADPAVIDRVPYDAFRAGLLRHIAMEEKVLFAEARRRRGGEPLPIVKQLHADHAAIASLLVPPPTHALVETLRTVLDEHNPLEEDPGGLYETCDLLFADDLDGVLARVHAIPATRVSQYLDEPRIHHHIARMLAARVLPAQS